MTTRDKTIILSRYQQHDIKVGRSNDCEIYFSDSQISRHHATLIVDETGPFIVDRSTNGTYLNGKRVPPNIKIALSDGNVVQFGENSSLMLRVGASEIRVLAATDAERAIAAFGYGTQGTPSNFEESSGGVGRGSSSRVEKLSIQEESIGSKRRNLSFAEGTESMDVEQLYFSSGGKVSVEKVEIYNESTVKRVEVSEMLSRSRRISDASSLQRRNGIFERAKKIVKESPLESRNRFMVVSENGHEFVASREEAERVAEQYVPSIVIDMDSQVGMMNSLSAEYDNQIHRENFITLENIENQGNLYRGCWIAIRNGTVLGSNESRISLMDEYYQERYLPILFAQIPFDDE